MTVHTLDLTHLSAEQVVKQCPAATLPFAGQKIAWDCVLFGVAGVMGFIVLAALGLGFHTVWAKLALVPVITWLFLLCFGMGHEGLHGNLIRGTGKAKRLNNALSTVFAGISLASWHGFSYSHTVHHRNTNDPEKDANWWVVCRHGPAAAITVIAAPFLENFNNVKLCLQTKRYDVLRAILTYFAVAVVLVIGAGLTFGWTNVLILWVLPAYLNYCFIVLFVGILPHGKSAKAAVDPNSEPRDVVSLHTPFMQALVTFGHLGHNYHALHHVYTRVPMHRLGPVARQLYAKRDALGGNTKTA